MDLKDFIDSREDTPMTDIERIQKYLEESLGVTTVIEQFGNACHGSNDTIVVLVVEHYEDTERQWMLRLAPTVSFDCWENSVCIEEYFNTPEEIHWYLYQCEAEVYCRLFECLSREFEELYEANEDLRKAERARWEEDWRD